MKKSLILIILDGWGLGEPGQNNPIHAAEPKTMNHVHCFYPAGALKSSGIYVGLPWEEAGNSEVGHLTLGAGKILFQHFPKITMAIQDGSFFQNYAIKNAFHHARKNKSTIHLIGLLTEGNVHSSFFHLTSLLEMAKKENANKVSLHLFADGRDSPPNSATQLIKKLDQEIKRIGTGVISSLSGRHYSMNRDNHWERTELTYKILLGQGENGDIFKSAELVKNKGITDEYIKPTQSPAGKPIEENDSVLFFNFREDSMKQISASFLEKNFDKFAVFKFKNLAITTMTKYHEWQSNALVAFQSEKIKEPLGKILGDNGFLQLRIAETQKHAHVTYFFNGLRKEPFKNEYRVLIPSKNITHPEEDPKMMASALTDRAMAALNEGSFDFILINYANPDVIAHTGNFDATIKAIKEIDKQLERLLVTVKKGGHIAIITSDHGNAEVLLDPKTGEKQTKHDPSPVPIYIFRDGLELKRRGIENPLKNVGFLSDVAPTILEIMKLPKSPEMSGESLLEQLK